MPGPGVWPERALQPVNKHASNPLRHGRAPAMTVFLAAAQEDIEALHKAGHHGPGDKSAGSDGSLVHAPRQGLRCCGRAGI
jgi:hypothetical protein